MLTADVIRDIILEELRHKGYAPNPGDVMEATIRLLAAHKDEIEHIVEAAVAEKVKELAGESEVEAKRLASAGAPLITMPPAK